jgi:hypothetical protein
MENQFNHALDGIRKMMTVDIQSMINTGATDEKAVASFRDQLDKEIGVFMRTATRLARKMCNEYKMFEALMLDKLDELLEITDSPHPEYAKSGWYVSPRERKEPLLFYAYLDLWELAEWILDSSRQTDEQVFMPQSFRSIAGHELADLPAIADALYEKGVSAEFVTMLKKHFIEFLSRKSKNQMYRTFVNLKTLKERVEKCLELPPDETVASLYNILYELNVNTTASIAHCKVYIKSLVDSAANLDDKLEILAHQEKILRQATVERIDFDPVADRLVDELQRFITAEFECIEKTPAKPDGVTQAPDALPAVPGVLKLRVSNAHHAAQMRLMQETGYFDELDKQVIDLASQAFKSNRDKDIATAAFKQYFYDPSPGSVNDAFNNNLKQLYWMGLNWDDRGAPNLFAMGQPELYKFFLSLKTVFLRQ